LLGSSIGDPSAFGLDAAAAAAFLGLLWPRLKALQPIVVATAAAVIAVLLTPVLSPGLPILVAALAAVIVGGLNLFKPKMQAGEVQ
jgi:predicted branched-subunit amino acid permease